MKNDRQHQAKSAADSNPGVFAVRSTLFAFRGTGAPSLRPIGLLVLAIAALAILAPSAQARQARLFAGSFGAATSTIANPYPLGKAEQNGCCGPNALAVDSTAGPSQGDVYVTDTANHRVEKFDSSGHFLLMFGKEVNAGTGNPNVCTNAAAPTDVCQPGAKATVPGALKNPTLIAVDNSSGPSQGDVYVNLGFQPGREEIQDVELTGASGGTFTLSFEGDTTAPIPFAADRRAVAEALEDLPSIGVGNIRSIGSSGSWNVGFIGDLYATDVPQLTVNASGLTPPGASATVHTINQGAAPLGDRITKFDEHGQLISSWATAGQLDGSAAPGGPFLDLVGIAVDPAGNLWVLGRQDLQAFEFKQDAGLLPGWTSEGLSDLGEGSGGLALDSEDNLYYKANNLQSQDLLKFNAAGTHLGSVVIGLGQQVRGYAVDPTRDDLFVAVETFVETFGGPTEVQRYLGPACHPSGADHPCSPVESFGLGRLEPAAGPYTGLAVDPSGPADPVYVLGARSAQVTAFANAIVPEATTAKASGFTPASASLNGTVNPGGAPLTGCFFEWGETTEPYEHEATCEPEAAELGSGTKPLAVHAQIAVQSGKTYHFRLVATNAATDTAEEPARGSDLAFGPPLIESGSALSVAASSATLQLQVNPNDVETHARIEYGTEAGVYPNATPEVDLGGGGSIQSAAFNLQDLAPNTTYHYRVSAESTLGSPEGPDLTFTTQGAAVAALLPDNRGYELVSPPNKHGVPLLGLTFASVVQAAADGSGLTYAAKGAVGAEAPGNRSSDPSQLLSSRGSAGWSTADISTPHQAPAGINVGYPSEYQLFSTDLSRAVVAPKGTTPLSPQATEPTPYRREPGGTYTPLLTEANVPPETEFGGAAGFITATPDLGHVLLGSFATLTSDFAPGFKSKESRNIYDWSAGALRLVSQVPPGAATACGPAGPVCLPASEAGRDSAVGRGDQDLRNAISADGSRVVFHADFGPPGSPSLYLRDLSTEETVALDAAQGGTGESGRGVFQGASADGSRVFFTDASRLTADSTAKDAPDLYMCEVKVEAEHLACALTDLTVNTINPSEPANVLGSVTGASADGSAVYFVAQGALTAGEGAVPGDCGFEFGTRAGLGQCNLYRYDVEAKATQLVAVLSGADFPDWAGEQSGGVNLGNLSARVSPDGRRLAFMSSRSLTGYDNRDAASGQRDQEVFLYDAAANEGEGQLLCASCNPTGARPHGLFHNQGEPPFPLVDGADTWGGQTIAANIPGWTDVYVNYALHQSRYLSDSGRLFFNAADALVPQDSNGTEDVYQFEPPGVGDCTESNPSFAAANGGCLSLISSGTSAKESAFLDASESGNDVFFLTASRLVAKDEDAALDVYDARSGGGEPSLVEPVECSGDACQQPAVPPGEPTLSTSVPSGPGNLVECPKGQQLKGGKCVKHQSKKKHKKSHKKHKKSKRAANNHRRTSR